MKHLLQELRLQLGDVDKLGYPDALLVEYVNDAMYHISELRPEQFASPMTMKARKGEVQCIGDCCSSLISVDGVVDKQGNPIAFINEGDTGLDKAFSKKPITTANKTYTFTLRDDASKFFEVSPPVKPSEDVYFRITCVKSPEPLAIDDEITSHKYHELIIHYAMYRALSAETESQTSVNTANSHIKLFYDLITLDKKMDRK